MSEQLSTRIVGDEEVCGLCEREESCVWAQISLQADSLLGYFCARCLLCLLVALRQG